MEKLYELHTLIPQWVKEQDATPERQWFEYWLPILSGLSQQCVHPSIEIRHQALVYLQRLILSPELGKVLDQKMDHRVECFDIVLFPLLELLSVTKELDPVGLGETNLRLANLSTKILLQFSHALGEILLARVWGDMLVYLLRMSGGMEHVREGILESIKNVILVLRADGLLKRGVPIWESTWKHVDSVFPTLQKELETETKPDTQ
jgi:hypothetical protein